MGKPPSTLPAWLDLPRLARTQPLRNWHRYAACKGNPRTMFFRAGSAPSHEVQAMCRACPVRYACLADTIRLEARAPTQFRYGHFAATTPKQRRLIAVALKAAA